MGNTRGSLAPGVGKGAPDTTSDPNLVNRLATNAMKFGQTQQFQQKYGTGATGQYFLNFLQRATPQTDGSFILEGTRGGPKGALRLSDLGGEFAQLGKEYANWLAQEYNSSQDYQNYIGTMQANPGRDQTVLGPQASQGAGTLLGSTRSTVLG